MKSVIKTGLKWSKVMRTFTGKTVRQELLEFAANKQSLNSSWTPFQCILNVLDGNCQEGTLKFVMKTYFQNLTPKQERRLLKEVEKFRNIF